MIRNTILVVDPGALSVRLVAIHEQSRAIERGGQARADGAHLDVQVRERSGAVAEDVGGRGLGEGADAWEGQLVVGDGSGDGAPLGLGVDFEGVGCVEGVDLVDVGLVVAGKGIRAGDDADVWGELGGC